MLLLEQNDEWAVQRARYMALETMAALSDNTVARHGDLTDPAVLVISCTTSGDTIKSRGSRQQLFIDTGIFRPLN